MGMSLQDFCSCTPSEFKSIFDAWREREEATTHREWETTRSIISAVIAPYANRAVDIKKVMPFPWDDKEKGKGKRKRKIKESTPERVKELLSHITDW